MLKTLNRKLKQHLFEIQILFLHATYRGWTKKKLKHLVLLHNNLLEW